MIFVVSKKIFWNFFDLFEFICVTLSKTFFGRFSVCFCECYLKFIEFIETIEICFKFLSSLWKKWLEIDALSREDQLVLFLWSRWIEKKERKRNGC